MSNKRNATLCYAEARVTLTLDWTCVIEVEEARLQSLDVLGLIEHHRSELANPGMTSIAASVEAARLARE